jgi:hypothetical protein
VAILSLIGSKTCRRDRLRKSALVKLGSIIGGAGGASGVLEGAQGLGGDHGSDGNGGVGVVAVGNDTIINAGTIAGGLGGDGTTQADAVDLSDDGNTLTLENGYSFTGNVVSSSGTTDGDTLALGGTGDDTFDMSAIVSTAPPLYSGAT